LRTVLLMAKNCPDNCWGLLGSSLILLKNLQFWVLLKV
jgi:hypothetical protein